ncbi:hypothetical protein AAVH_31046 [Aphelenchoides avenae]|nr:hypothetical protein AAVH_31046 [Aphelenchus avenae]
MLPALHPAQIRVQFNPRRSTAIYSAGDRLLIADYDTAVEEGESTKDQEARKIKANAYTDPEIVNETGEVDISKVTNKSGAFSAGAIILHLVSGDKPLKQEVAELIDVAKLKNVYETKDDSNFRIITKTTGTAWSLGREFAQVVRGLICPDEEHRLDTFLARAASFFAVRPPDKSHQKLDRFEKPIASDADGLRLNAAIDWETFSSIEITDTYRKMKGLVRPALHPLPSILCSACNRAFKRSSFGVPAIHPCTTRLTDIELATTDASEEVKQAFHAFVNLPNVRGVPRECQAFPTKRLHCPKCRQADKFYMHWYALSDCFKYLCVACNKWFLFPLENERAYAAVDLYVPTRQHLWRQPLEAPRTAVSMFRASWDSEAAALRAFFPLDVGNFEHKITADDLPLISKV